MSFYTDKLLKLYINFLDDYSNFIIDEKLC